MEKFTNRVKTDILNKKYNEVTFESILSDIITESLDVIVKDDNSYEISGVGNLVDKFTLILKSQNVSLDIDVNEAIRIQEATQKSNLKAKEIIRLYETYSDDGFYKLVETKLNKIEDVEVLENTLNFLNNEVLTSKVSIYKTAITNRINTLKK